jgi:hypothetical protein
MLHVGINVYFQGDAEQRRLLLDGVRAWALAARAGGLSDAFWFCSFDARGPHVFAIFATTAEKREALLALLEERASAFLRESPSTAALPDEEVLRRHEECRGKALCSADEEEGIAENNTFRLFDHAPDRYPLWVASGLADPAAYWREVDRIAFWALERREEGSGTAAAVRWLAAVDRALDRLGVPADEYWRRHASTLIPALAERLQSEEDEVLASLPGAVGERNLRAFESLWGESPAHDALAGPAVEMLLGDAGRSQARRLGLLRELNHNVLSQLGQPVRAHIPLVLFAWQRKLSGSPA